MRNSDSPQGIYAPLSQTMTDSDSEEEIHNSSRHRNSNTISLQNSIRSAMTSDGHCNSFNSFTSDGEDRMSHNSTNYQHHNHHTDADNIAILGRQDSLKMEPMSPIRKCCFIASISVCILTIIVFLWVIPCDENSTCPAPIDRIKTHNWLNNYTKIEFKGIVNVVDGLRNWEKNLIFMYRGDKFFPEFREDNHKRNGIISLIGSSGAISWYDEMVNEPVAIDCTLIDSDQNEKPDCLVMDELGYLGVINPVSGQWIWKFISDISKDDNSNEKRQRSRKTLKKVDVLDFPVILPDLDKDGILDLLFATANENGNGRNIIRILSGRTGKPLGEGFKIPECLYVRKFQLNNDLTITFNCISNDTEVQRIKSLLELYSLTTNKSVGQQKFGPSPARISQHKLYGQRKDTEAQRSIYSMSGKELIIENRGKCPEDCNVTFILTEERDGKSHIIRNFSGSTMYGMVPAQMSFKSKDGKSKITGFVMKFWEWSKNFSDPVSFPLKFTTTPSTTTTTSSGKDENVNDNRTRNRTRKKRDEERFKDLPMEYNNFEHLIEKRKSFTVPSSITKMKLKENKNDLTNSTTDGIPIGSNNQGSIFLQNYKMRLIKETVVLIIFNSADTHIENTSQSNIVQFCRPEKGEMICQPDLNYQENSLLIADLDQDNSQELVSYYTTFVNDNEEIMYSNRDVMKANLKLTSEKKDFSNFVDNRKSDWKLVTYVQLLRLESELPILYEEVATHN